MATFKENALRVIAVIGLIALLLLGAWGIIQLAFALPGFFSGLGSANKTTAAETISLSVPAAVNSGSTFTATWTHKNQTAGQYSYSLSYACADGVTLKAPLPTGVYQAVPCNTPFNYTGAATSMPLIASATNSTSVAISVSATKLSTGAVTATASANTTVAPAAKAAATPAKTTTTTKSASGATYVAARRTTNLYGYPDLSVRILSNMGSVRAGSRVALQFEVMNIGTNVAASGWAFSAALPYNPVYTYASAPQQALYPGDKIIYTLGYDAQATGNTGITTNGGCSGWSYPCNQGQPVYGGPGTCNSYGPCAVPGYAPNVYGYYNPTYNQQTVSVQVDPYNQVWEQSESNNYTATSYTVY